MTLTFQADAGIVKVSRNEVAVRLRRQLLQQVDPGPSSVEKIVVHEEVRVLCLKALRRTQKLIGIVEIECPT